MAERILTIRNLSKSYGEQVVLKSVNLELHEGEILGLMGPSGSGKSVLLKCIIGLTRPDEGQVWMRDTELTCQEEHALSRLRARIGYVFQNGALFDSLTIEENLSYPFRKHTDMDDDEILRIVNQRLKAFGLEGTNDLLPHEISGGMRKRAGMLRATMLGPPLVLFDEPTSGLDPLNVQNFVVQITRIRRQFGVSGIFVSHDPAAISALCDRVALLWEGGLRFAKVGEIEKSEDPVIRSFFRFRYSGENHEQAS